MPKYLVRFPDEVAWAAWLGALGGVVALVCRHFGMDEVASAAITTFVTVTGRLLTGMLLPTPTRLEAVAAAVSGTGDGK